MRLRIRQAISGLVLASIMVSAIGVHVLWWRTAEANSHALADTINGQIVSAVEKELTSITTEARAAHTAIRTLFLQHVLETREADKREFVFLSQLQSQQDISWVAFGWPDEAFFAAHKLGDLSLEMMEIAPVDGTVKRRVDEYQVVVGDIQFEKRRFEKTDYVVTDQEWFKTGMQIDEPRWFNVMNHPVGVRPSIAYVGPVDVYQKRQGVLAVIIEYTRLAQFLSHLSVGKSGAAFIVGRNGATIAAPDPDADEIDMQRADQPLLPIAHAAIKQAGSAYDSDKKVARAVRLIAAGNAYAVTLTPLAFPGWTLATVIPEAEFLGPIEKTIRQLLVGLAILILAAGIISAWLARRVIATPLILVVDELKHVARFDLEKVRRHTSRLIELENLSNAIADMAGGLAAFRKYIPADLVKTLVSEGVEPRPGGAIRNLTVLFADIAQPSTYSIARRRPSSPKSWNSYTWTTLAVQPRREVGLLDEHRAKTPGPAVRGQDPLEDEDSERALGAALLGEKDLRHPTRPEPAHDSETPPAAAPPLVVRAFASWVVECQWAAEPLPWSWAQLPGRLRCCAGRRRARGTPGRGGHPVGVVRRAGDFFDRLWLPFANRKALVCADGDASLR